jgi:hypothetical protein
MSGLVRSRLPRQARGRILHTHNCAGHHGA